jgi:hypothetical protein
MFSLSDLNEKYTYDYSIRKSITIIFGSKRINKKNPYQLVTFINNFVTTNQWEWDRVTLQICKRIEYLVQEELPPSISNKKEIYSWIIKGWKK